MCELVLRALRGRVVVSIVEREGAVEGREVGLNLSCGEESTWMFPVMIGQIY